MIALTISTITKRLLLARSGGFCANPYCHQDLFPLFEEKKIQNVEELAHIIAESDKGPRGKSKLSIHTRNKYSNIILLCPTCHRKIDKFPKLYPTKTILNWKKDHEQKIINCFKIKKYKTRTSIRKEFLRLILSNQSVFESYGPDSKLAKTNPTETEQLWFRKSIDIIIPNNKTIQELVENHYNFLTQKEKSIFELWKRHKESFESNKLSQQITSALIFYPKQFNNLFNGKTTK